MTSDPTAAWAPARLIPAVKLKSETEMERRAASVLLAVMRAVPDLAHSVLRGAGLRAPKGKIATYTEVPLVLSDKRKCRPDGMIVIERGNKRWSCLVEIKVGTAELTRDQVECYLDACKDHDFDAVLTISNQITRSAEELPIAVDKRKLRSTKLVHLSWWNILAECVLAHRHRGVADPEQAWLVGELIAYLDHDNSGTCAFTGMGSHWVQVRNAARQGTLRKNDPGVLDVAGRFEQFIDYLSLSLSQDLGCEVKPARPRGVSRDDRLTTKVLDLASDGCIRTTITVPDTAGPMDITADLRAKRTTVSTTVASKGEGRPLTRVNWLLRQLKDAPDDIRVTVQFERTKETTSALLADARAEPELLLSSTDPKRNPRKFELALGKAMGLKAGRGPKSFVGETRRQVLAFYETVLQGLVPWQAPAPKVAKKPDPLEDAVPPAISEERVWYMPAVGVAE